MLMMLASLTASAQYPTTKKIKGTQVVIMTVPQAEQIDRQFTFLNDSIYSLNRQIGAKTKEVRVINGQREKVIDSLQVFRFNLLVANRKIDSLNNQMRRIERLEYVDKRTRVRVGMGLAAVVISFVAFTFLLTKS